MKLLKHFGSFCYFSLTLYAVFHVTVSNGKLGARKMILKGLSNLSFPRDTKPIYVVKQNAEAIAWTSNSRIPYLTASQLGKGRVIAFASENFVNHRKSDSRYFNLYQRLCKWVSNGHTSVSLDLAKVKGRFPSARGTFHIWSHRSSYSHEEMKQLILSIRKGRINLILHIPEMKQNKEYLRQLLNDIGIFGPSRSHGTSNNDIELNAQDLIDNPVEPIQVAFPKLAKSNDFYFLHNAEHIINALSIMPYSELAAVGVTKSAYARLLQFRQKHAEKYAPTSKSRITGPENKNWALIYNRMYSLNDFLTGSNIRAPNVHDYPGAVDQTKAKIVKAEITIDARVHDEIHATGFYLPPGGTAEVKVLQNNVTGGSWTILIGCWSDVPKHHHNWIRYPNLQQGHRLDNRSIFSAFGGNVLIRNNGNSIGIVKLQLSGVIESPYLNLRDKKSIKDWNARVKRSGSPWADLSGDMISFCIPTRYVKNRTSSEMEYMVRNIWDNIVKTNFEFAGNNWKQSRRERIVLDKAPKIGCAHSGYPIVAKHDNGYVLSMVDRKFVESHGSWTLLHELGHNRQHGGFKWGAVRQVTCNVFNLMNYDLILKFPRHELNHRVWSKKHLNYIIRYIKNGAPYDVWSSSSIIALAVFDQFAKHFGWGTTSKWMQTYTQTMKHETPRNDKEKIDQWADRMINITEMNLMPLYDFWNIPVSQVVLNKAKRFPCFLPLDWMTGLVNGTRYTMIDQKYAGKCQRKAKKYLPYTSKVDLRPYHTLDVKIHFIHR